MKNKWNGIWMRKELKEKRIRTYKGMECAEGSGRRERLQNKKEKRETLVWKGKCK